MTTMLSRASWFICSRFTLRCVHMSSSIFLPSDAPYPRNLLVQSSYLRCKQNAGNLGQHGFYWVLVCFGWRDHIRSWVSQNSSMML
jgi:hypothetical protein